MAEATKISMRFLQALEADRGEVLPGGALPRAPSCASTPRTWASIPSAPSRSTCSRPPATPRARPISAPTPAQPPAPRVRRGSVFALLGAGAVGFLTWPQRRPAEREPPAVQPPASAPAPAPLPSLSRDPPPPTGPTGPTGSTGAGRGGERGLRARPAGSAELLGRGAGRRREGDGPRVLAEGESQTLSAREEIVLSVGNAGGPRTSSTESPA